MNRKEAQKGVYDAANTQFAETLDLNVNFRLVKGKIVVHFTDVDTNEDVTEKISSIKFILDHGDITKQEVVFVDGSIWDGEYF